jgi:D-alanyl-D-alanine carboxypeptidase
VDAQTGVILHQENVAKRLHPASLTKMMTLLMLFDAMKAGKVDADDRIVISRHAASMPPSKIGLKAGSTIKVEDAIFALVTKSANDIAVAVAEHLGRSESNFARLMTRRAQNFGMKETVFRNASGLHNPAQVSSARDMARLGMILIRDYGDYYPYFAKQNFNYRGVNYRNHNRLMQSYKGMDGMKTGYIGASGFNLVASAVQNNRRIIGVVFGGRTAGSRNERMRVLLDEGFARLKKRGSEDGASALVAAAREVPVPPKKPSNRFDVATLRADDLQSERQSALSERFLQEQALIDQQPENMQINHRPAQRWAMLESGNSSSILARMGGEGDYDNDVRGRIETGLIAVSAHTGQPIPPSVWEDEEERGQPQITQAALSAPVQEDDLVEGQSADWAIQIGAFTSRERTDKAIATSLKQLPQNLRSVSAVIAPVQTPQGWIFRARLNGYTKAGAEQACAVLAECIPIAPYVQ